MRKFRVLTVRSQARAEFREKDVRSDGGLAISKIENSPYLRLTKLQKYAHYRFHKWNYRFEKEFPSMFERNKNQLLEDSRFSKQIQTGASGFETSEPYHGTRGSGDLSCLLSNFEKMPSYVHRAGMCQRSKIVELRNGPTGTTHETDHDY